MYVNKLRAADSVLALLIFFPSLVIYWRGSWDLIQSIIFPGREPLCWWVITAIGCCKVFSYYAIPLFNKYITPDKKWTYIIVGRLFLILHGALYMFIWRGVWGLGDYYVTNEWKWALVQTYVVIAVLILFRVLRHAMWPPFVTALDKHTKVFVASNRFKTLPEHGAFKYFLDCSFTCLFVGPVAITSWRCQWAFLDGFVFPEDPLKSDIICASGGLVASAILFALQHAFAAVSIKCEKADRPWLKLIWEDLVYILIFNVMTVYWHGTWNLCIRYMITDPLIGGLVNHCLGTVLLLLTRTYSMIGVCGCAVDGFGLGGEAFFPIDYCSKLVEFKRLKNESNQHGKSTNVKESTLEVSISEPLPVYNAVIHRNNNGNKSGDIASASPPDIALDVNSENDTSSKTSTTYL